MSKNTQRVIAIAQERFEESLANIASVERTPFAAEAQGDAVKPGEMYLANESAFVTAHFNEPLTTYAVSYQDNSGISALLDFLAPPVPVSRRFTYKERIQAEAFLADSANGDLRAIGGEFQTVKFTGKETLGRTDNRGLRIRIDLDEVSDPDSVLAGGVPAYQARAVEQIKTRLIRNSALRAIALYQAAAVNTAKTWDATAGKDPDQDLLNDLVTGTTARGFQSNRVLFGHTAWTKRMLSHRAQNNAGGYTSAAFTPDDLAGYLGLDEVLINKSRYLSGSSLAEVVGALVLEFFAEQGANLDDSSNVKRFVSPTDGGTDFRVYVQPVTSKLIDITVEKYEVIKVTSNLGIRTLTIS